MEAKRTKLKVVVSVLALAGLLVFSLFVVAGDLEPSGPPEPTMYSLDEIYNPYSSTAQPLGFVSSPDRGPTDIYIKFDGVEGEVQDKVHWGWSDLVSFSQGQMKPGTGTGPTRRRGDVVLEDLICVKEMDKASPQLAESVCKGKVFPKVEIHLTASYTDAGRVTYYAYELKNVLVVSYHISGQSGEVPIEEISLNFEEIKVTYSECDSQGNRLGSVEYSWKIEEAEI